MIHRLLKRLLRVVQVLAGATFMALFAVNLLRILLRNLIGVTWFWIDGFSRINFIWSIFLGAAALYATEDHLVMDFFVARMKLQSRRILALIINLAFLGFMIAVVYYGFLVLKVRMRIPYTYWNVPTGYAYLAAPVCGIIMLLFCLYKLGLYFSGRDVNFTDSTQGGDAGGGPSNTAGDARARPEGQGGAAETGMP